jgi:hypothetical protein
MVRAHGANRNAEIHAALSPCPQVRRSRFNAPSPAAGGGTGLRAGSWASGGRAGGLSRRAFPDGAGALC